MDTVAVSDFLAAPPPGTSSSQPLTTPLTVDTQKSHHPVLFESWMILKSWQLTNRTDSS